MPRPADRRAWLVALLPLAWAAALSPIALLDVRNASGRATFDQVLFHEHTIDALAANWPLAKLTYPEHYVAMTPGYHWVMAAIKRLAGLDDAGLRLASLLLMAVLFAVLGVQVARRCGWVLATAALAPLLGSVYVANSGAWLLADNAGWFWVGVLSLWALRADGSWRWAVVMGLGLLAAVWTRQNLLLLAMPAWIAAWVAPGGPGMLDGLGARVRSWLPMALATLPALASVAWLVHVWGGLVPYEFQGQYDGANPANLLLQLVTLAVLGPFFLPAVLGLGEPGGRGRASRMLRCALPAMVLAFVLACLMGLVVPTTHEPTAGRAGMAWSVFDRLCPVGPFGRHNPLTVLVAGLGAAVLVVVLAALPWRARLVLGGLWAGFAIAQCASSEAWQRYHEPFTLLFLALATMQAAVGRRTEPVAHEAGSSQPTGRVGSGPQAVPAVQWVPMALLAAGLAIASAVVLWQREIGPWRQGAQAEPVNARLPSPGPGPQDAAGQKADPPAALPGPGPGDPGSR
ncbi:MAG: hypothetical protein KatS3mg103_0604 [Phycisphaerales bacterium]|nr:MAG: hypothetical protein KatS3mg103_0604 [Phycisphaerales bacterium]